MAVCSKGAVVILHPAQHHFRMLCEIGIYRNAVLRISQMYPVRFHLHFPLPLLEKQDIRRHLGSGLRLKCCTGKPNRSFQIGPLRQILSHGRIALIHGSFGGNYSHHASGSYQIQGFRDKIIMNPEIVLVVGRVMDLIIAKGHISNNHIKKIGLKSSLFKAGNLNLGRLVQLPCYPSGYSIKFHTIAFAVLQRNRHTSEEAADSHRRFQYISGSKSELFQCLPHAGRHLRRRIKRSIDRGPRCRIFLRIQKLPKFRVFFGPA